MNNDSSTHVPFAQLPPEARFLFSICLMTIYGPERPPAEKVRTDLERIWDTEKLSLDDFKKSDRISEVFDKYAAIFRKDVWWLDAFGVSRKEGERAGFFRERRRRALAESRLPKPQAGGSVSAVTGDASQRA
jgi:hypothetical protein